MASGRDWDSFNHWGTGSVDELRAYIAHLLRERDDEKNKERVVARKSEEVRNSLDDERDRHRKTVTVLMATEQKRDELLERVVLLEQQVKHTTLKAGKTIEIWPAPIGADGKWAMRYVRVMDTRQETHASGETPVGISDLRTVADGKPIPHDMRGDNFAHLYEDDEGEDDEDEDDKE
jgi:hypothetical protein